MVAEYSLKNNKLSPSRIIKKSNSLPGPDCHGGGILGGCPATLVVGGIGGNGGLPAGETLMGGNGGAPGGNGGWDGGSGGGGMPEGKLDGGGTGGGGGGCMLVGVGGGGGMMSTGGGGGAIVMPGGIIPETMSYKNCIH